MTPHTEIPDPVNVSRLRLILLRGTYILLFGGTALTIWPQLINHVGKWPLWYGVGCSMLTAMSVLSAIGIWNPLRMLPLLLFEIAWKGIWLTAVALPMWISGLIDPATAETVVNCLVGAFIPFVVPWRYVAFHYLKREVR